MQDSDAEEPEMTQEERERQAEFERHEAETGKYLNELMGDGWRRPSNGSATLEHPTDPDLSVWVDPFTSEIILSKKLAERIEAELRRGKDQGREG